MDTCFTCGLWEDFKIQTLHSPKAETLSDEKTVQYLINFNGYIQLGFVWNFEVNHEYWLQLVTVKLRE